MRRVGRLWPQVTAFDNLLRACDRAARGKRRQRALAHFLAEREPRLLALRRELVDERYRPGRMSSALKVALEGIGKSTDRLTWSFDKLDELTGGLPRAAREHRSSWTNDEEAPRTTN